MNRSLVTDFPRSVSLGETASLLVLLSAGVVAGALPVSVPLGTVIDLVVRPEAGFELVGAREQSLTVVDADETPPVRFRLQATQAGRGRLKLYAFVEGRSLGTMTLEADVVDGPVNAVANAKQTAKPLPAIQAGAAPDLSLLILEQTIGNRPCLTLSLRTREPYASPRIKQQYDPVPLELDPQERFRRFFGEIERADSGGALWQELSHKGADLFRTLFPRDLQAALWALRDRIHSVEVQSAEPWIPWELCKLVGRDDADQIVEGPFFCDAFSLTRWIPDLADKTTISMNRVALVAPAGSGLANADAERAYVKSLATGGRVVDALPATLDGVLEALSSGQYDAWHFVCHGSAGDDPDRAAIELDGGVPLRPEHLSGKAENLGRRAPIVFLNACQSALGARTLTGVGGWAARFLHAAADEDHPRCGASAFLGTYWKIDDQAAFAFAKKFYDELLGQKATIGDAAREARRAIRAPDDPTWLAYTVFAHPLARVG